MPGVAPRGRSAGLAVCLRRRTFLVAVPVHILASFVFLAPAFLTGALILPARLLNSDYPWGAYRPGQIDITPRLGDAILQFYPWFLYWGRCVRSGLWPLWNPYSALGVPFGANPLTASYFPLTALSLAGAAGWNVLLFSRLVLAGIATFAWLRALGRSREAAMLGSLAYAFCLPFVAWLPTSYANVGALFPLLLLAARNVAVRGRPRDAGIFGVALLFVHLGGHPESAFLGAIVAVLVWGHGVLRAPPRVRLRSLGLLLLGGVAGTVAASAHLLPFLEYFSESRVLLEGEHHPMVLQTGAVLTWLFPGSMNLSIDEAGFAGVSILCLATFALFMGRRLPLLPMVIAAVVPVGLAYGLPVFRLIGEVPPLHQTMTHRGLFITALALATLASFGWDRLRTFSRLRGRRRALAMSLPVAVLVPVAGLLLAWHFGISIRDLAPCIGLSLAPFVIAAIISTPSLRFTSVVVLALFDLWRPAFGYHAVVPPQDVFFATRLTDFLNSDTAPHRVLPTNGLLPPNTNLAYDIQSLLSYDALDVEEEVLFLRKIGGYAGRGYYSGVRPGQLSNPRVAELLDTKYVLDDPLQPRLDTEEFRSRTGFALSLVYDGIDGRAYRLDSNPGRVWIPAGVVADPGFRSFDALLDRRDHRVSSLLFLDTTKASVPAGHGETKITVYAPGRIETRVNTERGGWVVFSELFSRDWRGTVNGMAVTPVRVNRILMAVPIPAGESTVRLRYLPRSFKIGLGLSALGLVILGVLLVRRPQMLRSP
jgi:hypothetical protein